MWIFTFACVGFWGPFVLSWCSHQNVCKKVLNFLHGMCAFIFFIAKVDLCH